MSTMWLCRVDGSGGVWFLYLTRSVSLLREGERERGRGGRGRGRVSLRRKGEGGRERERETGGREEGRNVED